ncbi:MAG: hypothetical protein Fues2KO_44770 [Fuerstiella sp.]
MKTKATNSSSKAKPGRVANVVIRASAGTGKTFQLSNRYLHQLFSGAQPEQILATTFTRKAAGEILERNMLRLAEAARDEAACRELGTFIDRPDLTQAECLDLLRKLTQGLHRVRICTLDSFFSQITTSFGFEMGLPPDWSIVDEIDQVRLKNKAVEAVLRNESTEDAVRLMHLLTRGETNRTVSELIRQTVDSLYPIFQETGPEAWQAFPDIKLLTREKLDQAIQQLSEVPLPKHKKIEEARSKDLEQALAHDWEAFVKGGLAKVVAKGDDTYYRKPLDESVLDVYRRLLKHAKAVLVDLVARQTAATYQLLQRFDLRYSQLKDDARVLQFDDITRLLADVAADYDIRRLAYRMDGAIDHLLLDEFQDTSLAQWHVLRPFATYATERRKNRSFFCVGDSKQAIYGWRGGVAEIFDAIDEQLSGLQQETLNRSFRSAPAIMETTNRIFNGLKSLALQNDDNGDDQSIRRWCQQFMDHSTARSELPGYAVLQTAPRAEEASEQSDLTVQYAAKRIAELHRQSPQYSIGVLARKNAVVSQLIFELRKLGVAASEEGGNPLADSAAVQLIMSVLKLADHPGNTAARYHVAQSPLGARLQLSNHANHWQAESVSRHLRQRLQAEGYGPVVREWAELLADYCGPRGQRRLDQLVELAYAWQSYATLRTADFLRYLELKKIPDPTVDRIRVMTVHQSKGLEFDLVVLPDLDAKLIGQAGEFVVHKPSPTEPIDRVCRYRNKDVREVLPSDFQQMFDEQRRSVLAEAMCVLYVAVTRAKHALHMIVSPSRPTEKKPPKSAGGLLRHTLHNGGFAEAEQTLFETGDEFWWHTDPAASDKAAKKSQPAAAPQSSSDQSDGVQRSSAIEFRPMTGGRLRGMQRVAPSKHQTHRTVRLASVIRHDSAAAMDRGTLIHAWFEQIEWLDSAHPLEDAFLKQRAEQLGLASLDVDSLLGEFKAMLQSEEIARGLSPSAYRPPETLPLPKDLLQQFKEAGPDRIRLEVHNEHPFAVRDEGELMSGFIDRLVLIYIDNQLTACDIIDFKTDTFAFDDQQLFDAKVQFYKDQLESYRRVVARLYRIPVAHVVTRLFMLGAGRIADV